MHTALLQMSIGEVSDSLLMCHDPGEQSATPIKIGATITQKDVEK